MDGMADPDTIRARAEELRQRITAAGDRHGRVTLVAVTKGFGPELIPRALEAGLVDLGENYAQELAVKAGSIREAPPATGTNPRWHFIGGLQTNKVKLLAGVVDLWQTIDRPALVDALARRAPGARILVQVNTTGEAQKSGCALTEAPALVESARQRGLEVAGLMTVGPTDATADPRPGFAALRELARRCEVDELSMGMSGDFEAAVAEGATIVRIGSALFGPRPAKATA